MGNLLYICELSCETKIWISLQFIDLADFTLLLKFFFVKTDPKRGARRIPENQKPPNSRNQNRQIAEPRLQILESIKNRFSDFVVVSLLWTFILFVVSHDVCWLHPLTIKVQKILKPSWLHQYVEFKVTYKETQNCYDW